MGLYLSFDDKSGRCVLCSKALRTDSVKIGEMTIDLPLKSGRCNQVDMCHWFGRQIGNSIAAGTTEVVVGSCRSVKTVAVITTGEPQNFTLCGQLAQVAVNGTEADVRNLRANVRIHAVSCRMRGRAVQIGQNGLTLSAMFHKSPQNSKNYYYYNMKKNDVKKKKFRKTVRKGRVKNDFSLFHTPLYG